MDSRVKKRVLINVIIGIFALISLIIYFYKLYQVVNWQLIIGTMLVIAGTSVIFTMLSLRNIVFKERIIALYAIILNPGFASIFSGILAITTQSRDKHLQHATTYAGIALILSFLIGFVALIIALIKKK